MTEVANTTVADTENVVQDNTQQAAPAIDMELRVRQYVQLRDLIKERDDEHKKKMAPYRETLEKLGALLLEHLDTIGGESVKSAAGTVYKTVRKSASIQDGDAFMKYVINSEAWDLLDRKANVTAVEDFAKENGVLPPGVRFTQTNVVGVRRK